MKNILLNLLSMSILFISVSKNSAQIKNFDLSKEEKNQAIEKVISLINRFYVFPETAKKMEGMLKTNLLEGKYESITDADRFAKVLTEDMLSICKDKHFGLYLGVNPDNLPKEDVNLRRINERFKREQNNFGIKNVDILKGNVGYMKITSVMFYNEIKDILDGAMKVLANTDAIIFDIRDNTGGDAAFMTYLFSYFFENPTHLNSIYWRDRDKTTESWTVKSVNGKKMSDVPLYVIINKNTFSGGEEFAYDIQSRKRGVIIGEPSKGGAHPSSTWVVFKNIRISIPYGRAINPVTGLNWEGTGVIPDIRAEEEKMFETAYDLAKTSAAKYSEEKKNKLLSIYNKWTEKYNEALKLYSENKKDDAEKTIFDFLKICVESKIFTESQINQIGYDNLNNKNYDMAVAILRFNTEAFPGSANAFDSLGEIYLKTGDKIKAVECYEKAVKLNPELTSSINALKELNKNK